MSSLTRMDLEMESEALRRVGVGGAERKERLLDLREFGTQREELAGGAHVDEEALVEALKSGIIAGAALDVYESEPAIPSELLSLPNVVLSPHTGTGTWEGRIAMCENVCDNIIAFVEGRTDAMNIVN